jgi:hypothetical protein
MDIWGLRIDIQDVKLIISILIGAIIAWLIALCFYRRSKKETAALLKQNDLLLRAQEKERPVKYNLGPDGERIGYIEMVDGTIKGKSSASGKLSE